MKKGVLAKEERGGDRALLATYLFHARRYQHTLSVGNKSFHYGRNHRSFREGWARGDRFALGGLGGLGVSPHVSCVELLWSADRSVIPALRSRGSYSNLQYLRIDTSFFTQAIGYHPILNLVFTA